MFHTQLEEEKMKILNLTRPHREATTEADDGEITLASNYMVQCRIYILHMKFV